MINCPIHADERLHKLQYTKSKTVEGKLRMKWMACDHYLCVKCDRTYKVEMKIVG